MTLDHETRARATTRQLLRVDDDSVFAYVRGLSFIRCRDEMPWAHLSHGQLFSNRSGNCLAYKIGAVYYDATTHEPLYYESS